MGANKFNVICYGYNPWSNLWKRNQTMVSMLARQPYINDVLFVNPQVYIGDLIKTPYKELNRFRRNYWRYVVPRKVEDSVTVFTPVVLPLSSQVPCLGETTYRIDTRVFRPYVDSDYVLLLNRFVGFNDRTFSETFAHASFKVFDWSDDFETFTSSESIRQTLAGIRDRYLEECDLVIAVNDHLAERARRVSEQVYTVRNATNFESLNSADRPETKLAPAFHRIPKPVIGYMGNLCSARLDRDLLDYLSVQRPDWHLVFLGPHTEKYPLGKELAARKNIHVLPPVAYSDLPRSLKGFDVCMIPHLLNEHTMGNDPIKLFDYLATGRPVVSTPTAGTAGFDDVISIARSKEEFLHVVEKLLESGNSPDMKAARIERARQNSWTARFGPVFRLLEENLAERSSGPGAFEPGTKPVAARLLPWLLFACVILLGILIRVTALGYRSLWIDEAWVANLIGSDDYLRTILLEKPAYWSPLPFLFAVSTKLAVTLFGDSETTLRMVPCLFGIASLAVFCSLGRELFRESRLWMVPAGLVALHNWAAYYSKELKQYSGEVFFSALLLYLFMRLSREKSPRLAILFLLAALLAVGYGIPSAFLAMSILTVLAVRSYQAADYKFLGSLVAVGIALGLVEALHYFLWLGPQLDPTYSSFWHRPYFPPNELVAIPRWMANCAFGFFNYDFGYGYPSPFLGKVAVSFTLRVVFCIGLVRLFLGKHRDFVYVYVITMTILLVLSFLHKWPLGGNRVNLFLLPFHLAFLASGIGLIAVVVGRLCRKVGVRWAVGAMSALLFFPVQTLDENLWHLKQRAGEEMRPIVEYVKDNLDPDTQRLYVYYGAHEAFTYYWSRDSRYRDENLYYLGIRSRDRPEAYPADVAKFLDSLPEPVESVYLIISHVIPEYRSEPEIFLKSFRETLGNEIGCKEYVDTYAYLFRITR